MPLPTRSTVLSCLNSTGPPEPRHMNAALMRPVKQPISQRCLPKCCRAPIICCMCMRLTTSAPATPMPSTNPPGPLPNSLPLQTVILTGLLPSGHHLLHVHAPECVRASKAPAVHGATSGPWCAHPPSSVHLPQCRRPLKHIHMVPLPRKQTCRGRPRCPASDNRHPQRMSRDASHGPQFRPHPPSAPTRACERRTACVSS